jgi:AraC family transcriptional regulator, regulatory protein of adaptative response / methylated-DNA-[protein]-cysteine methyltransferase
MTGIGNKLHIRDPTSPRTMALALTRPPVPAPLWQAILERRRSADGTFVFGVGTTRIFCRPSCPARRPARENVEIFRTVDEATQAGYRACLRCRPTELHKATELVARAIAIANRETRASLGAIAKELDVSDSTLQRAFSDETGLPFGKYRRAVRNERARGLLLRGQTVQTAARTIGASSASKLYNRDDGLRPGEIRNGAEGHVIRFHIAESMLGLLLVAATDKGICAVRFGDDRDGLVDDLAVEFPRATIAPADQALASSTLEILRRIEGKPPSRELPLDIRGTVFRLRVWRELLKIRPGTTTTYSDLAQRIGAPTSVRAVASACAANGLAVLVPCHRVVAKGGSLTGYRWGVPRKERLLAAEAKEDHV